MRIKRTRQMSIYEIFTEHKIAVELDKISSWLDAHTDVSFDGLGSQLWVYVTATWFVSEGFRFAVCD